MRDFKKYIFAVMLLLVGFLVGKALAQEWSQDGRLTAGPFESGQVLTRIGDVVQGITPRAAPSIGTDNATVTTTSSSYVTMTGGSVTPGAGTWMVLAVLNVEIPNTGSVTLSLFNNGVQVAASEQTISSDGGTLSGVSKQNIVLTGTTTTADGQVVDVRWKTPSGTARMFTKTLLVLQ